MQPIALKKILAISVLFVFLLAMAPAAWSDMGGHMGDRMGGHMWGEGHHGFGRMGHKIKSIEVPITITGTSGNTTAFTVSAVSVEGKRGKAAVVTFDKPLTGVYNTSSDMAYISTKGMDGMNVRVDTMANTSVPVAGASAILCLGKIKTEYRGKDISISEFHKFSVYLPDGTIKSYDLEKPVKVIKSKDRKAVVWDAYPGFTKAISDALSSGMTFPASSGPMKVRDLASAETSATATTVKAPMSTSPSEF